MMSLLRNIGLGLLLAISSGCGGGRPDGPPLYAVSGKVTHAGAPVPRGTVTFEPDSAQGNTGPSVTAEIRDGKFATMSGKGTVGGPHLVTISGTDGQPAKMPDGMELPDGKLLFPDYSTKVDLPKAALEHDFDVPQGKK